MPASTSLKAADKTKIAKKLVTELKKKYKGGPPKHNRSVFETLLFSALLEDATYEQAEAALERLLNTFFDLNEIRVSSVKEIEEALGDIPDPDWKAMRAREVLQYVFETYYAFDLEPLKRKTQDAANKELNSIPHLSTFMRDYTVQMSLGAHVIPIDTTMARVLKWLGLAEANLTNEQVADAIKPGLKKSDGPQFCYSLKCAATDAKLQPAFEDFEEIGEVDPFDAASRLAALIKKPVARKIAKKKTTKVSSKKPVKKKTKARKAKTKTKSKTKTKTATKAVKKKKPVKKQTTTSKKARKRAKQ